MGFNPIDRRINPFKPFYKIDANGFLIDSIGVEISEDNPDPDPPDGFIHIPPPPNYYKPRWDGESWVEGATSEEIDEIERRRRRGKGLQQQLHELKEENELNAMAIMDLAGFTIGGEGGE